MTTAMMRQVSLNLTAFLLELDNVSANDDVFCACHDLTPSSEAKQF
jgi:hypothetical protein